MFCFDEPAIEVASPEEGLMKVLRILAGTAVLAGGLLGTAAQAAITYLDANFAAGGNTTLPDGSAVTAVDVGSAGSGADGSWRIRTNVGGNSTSLYEANGDFTAGGNTENVPRVRTTISGLTPNANYNVFVYFVGNADPMRIGASLTDSVGALPVYTVGQALVAGSGVTQVTDGALANFTNVVTNDNSFGTDRFYQISLGPAQATGAGTIAVYVDDDSSVDRTTDGGNLRSVYDGVGSELVPEPTSLGLASLAAAALLRRRRRA
jgi:hypothetical protein